MEEEGLRCPTVDAPSARPEVPREEIAQREVAARREFLQAVDEAREQQLREYGSDVVTHKTPDWLLAILLREVAAIAERLAMSPVEETDEEALKGVYEALARTGAVTAALYEWLRVCLGLGLVRLARSPHPEDLWYPYVEDARDPPE